MYRHYIRSYEILKKYDGVKSSKTEVRQVFTNRYKTVNVDTVHIPDEEDLIIDLCFLGVSNNGYCNYLYVTTKPDNIIKYSLKKGVYY